MNKTFDNNGANVKLHPIDSNHGLNNVIYDKTIIEKQK